VREGLGDAPRATRSSVGRLATAGSVQPKTQMPHGLIGQRLQYYAPKTPQIYKLWVDYEESVCLWEGVLRGSKGCNMLGIASA
jgi:hypothetical protein